MISGTVYKIVDKRVPEGVLYVGSTETSLHTRWGKHKNKVKSSTSKKNTYIREQGVEHFELVSLERRMFKDNAALREREEEYRIKLNPTLNSYKCFRNITESQKQYYAENREKIQKRVNEPLTCEVCGGSTTRANKARHERLKTHAAAVVAPFVRARFGRAALLAKR
jgi:ribosomal protein L44E